MLDELSKTSEKTKPLGKKKQRPKVRARPGDLRRPDVCQKCGNERRTMVGFPLKNRGEGSSYYICTCGAICAWR